MKKWFGAAMAVAVLSAASAHAQPGSKLIDMHLAAAKAAAGFDFTGLLARLCVAPQTGPGRDVAPAPAPERSTWYTEPAQVFDNLYFVGTKIHSSWALTTSRGIILIDTLYEYATDEEIIQGLRKLGLDPADIKYVIVSHAHGDHVGGAKMIQERFGARIIMGKPDWDSIAASQNQYPNGKPIPNMDAEDGERVTLGDTVVTLVLTPGHTPGTVSMIFEVRDHGRPLTVAYSGGTAFNFINDVEHFNTYINSQKKMAEAAARYGATIIMSNHSEFDNAVTKIKLMAARKPGEPHPFEVGRAAVQRYFRVGEECAEVAKLRLAAEASAR